MKKTMLLSIIAAVGAISAWTFFSDWPEVGVDNSGKQNSIDNVVSVANAPAPTLPLFYEMTIPHMREKKYTASLAPLIKTYEKQKHTGYLTSYQSDGLKINGLLTVPKGNPPTDGWPAVVFVHGYIPPAAYRTLTRYTDHVNYLADNGLVVFKIDLRGHGDSEGEAGGAYYSTDYVTDTLNAYAALELAEYVNSKKIGLWGHSMAGNVILRTAAVKPEIPAVIIWAGAVYTYADMAEYGIQDNSYRPPPSGTQSRRRRQEIVDTYGPPDLSRDFWKQYSPVTFLKDLKGFVQIHHAIDDDVVSIEYSRNLINILQNAGAEHELYEYPGGGHNISGSYFQTAIERSAIKLRGVE